MAKVISSRVNSRKFGALSLIGLAVVAALLAVLVTAWPAQAAATETVSNLNDSGPGSLRAAILNVDVGGTILFSVTGTIVLTGGELDVNQSVSIVGPGSGDLTISGNGTSRVFQIIAGTVTISGVTIADGIGDFGAGIRNSAVATLDDVTVRDNTATGGGGGILNRVGTTMTLNNTVVEDNSAPLGAGIANDGDLTLNDVTISGNNATERGGGIENLGTLTDNNGTIIGNTATNDGGGIWSHETGRLVLNDTLIQENVAANGGGVANDGRFELGGGATPENAVYVRCDALFTSCATLYLGDPVPGEPGNFFVEIGNISLRIGDADLNNVTFFSNSASERGAGIFNRGGMTLDDSLLVANGLIDVPEAGLFRPVQGGGIYNDGVLEVTRSQINLNAATFGSGIFNHGANIFPGIGQFDDGFMTMASSGMAVPQLIRAFSRRTSERVPTTTASLTRRTPSSPAIPKPSITPGLKTSMGD